MALNFIDGFDHYATSSIGDKGYSTFGGFTGGRSIDPTGGRRGGGAMKWNSSPGAQEILTLPTEITDNTIVAGFAVKLSAYTSARLFVIGETSGKLVQLDFTSGGALTMKNSITSTSVATANSFVPVNTYFYLEVKVFRDNTVGTLELKKDGVSILTITGEDTTRGANVSVVEFGQQYSGFTLRVDDLYVLDGSTANNNDYLGDVRIDTHYASADGATSDFTPFSATTNTAQVDESPNDNDTTFVEAGTITDKDTYTMDTASLGSQIYGVQAVTSHKKTDAGTVTMDVIMEKPSGSGVTVISTDTSNDDYKFTVGITDEDPDDDTTWTDAKVNAQEFGFKINNITT